MLGTPVAKCHYYVGCEYSGNVIVRHYSTSVHCSSNRGALQCLIGVVVLATYRVKQSVPLFPEGQTKVCEPDGQPTAEDLPPEQWIS